MKVQAIYNKLQLALFMMLATACTNTSPEKQLNELTSLAKSSTLLSVDPSYFTDSLYHTGQKEIPAEDLRILKAAIHRIYSNVTIVDNAYVLHVKTGSEIQIAEHLFERYKEDIAKNNALIKAQNKALFEQVKTADKADQEIDSIKIKPITEAYLNALLE